MAAQATPPLGFALVDVTADAGLRFRHTSGAYGGKLLPETLGSGCAFLDYDADGWQDILLVNGMEWAGHRSEARDSGLGTRRPRSTLRLYHNNRNGTFSDVTRAAGLDVELYGMGVAVGDVTNDGFPDVLVTCVGQNRLFRNTGKGTFVDATRASGLNGRTAFSTSAVWVDFDRDGFLDLFVCNYVKWTAEHDVFCSLDGKQKSYCTPEAYRGAIPGKNAIGCGREDEFVTPRTQRERNGGQFAIGELIFVNDSEAIRRYDPGRGNLVLEQGAVVVT